MIFSAVLDIFLKIQKKSKCYVMCDMNMYDQKIKTTIAFYKCILCYNKKALHRNRFNFFEKKTRRVSHVTHVSSETETCAAHLFY